MIHRYLFLFILFPCLAQAAREVVLLDTREARDSLNWYKISVNGNFNDGWGELSFEAKTFPSLILPTSSSTLWRTQYVCDITAERRVDNWLRSPYLKRQQAQRIEIELGFSIRDCATFQTPNEIRSCRETFELYIHENDTEDNSQQWSSYKLIDIIAGNRFTSNNYGSQYSTNRNNLTVNVKTRGISVQKNGFYIAFRDQGACISLLYVKIYYRLCEDRLIGLVQFPETSIGSSLTDIVERYGICSINSQLKHRPIGFCKGNGEWTFEETSLHDSCHCQQGYELLIENHLNNQYSRAVCKLCPMGTYKSTVSNHQFCQTCPLNSYTKDKGAIVCHCNDGFFRLNSSMFDSPCIGNPNEPENVTIDKIDQASVRISWKQIDDRIYHLECHPSIPCESYFIYQPNRTFINSSNVKIIGLKENTNYRMKLFTEQISTHLLSKSIDLSFTTKRSISQQIRQISIDRLTFNTILLSWSSENFDSYELLYWSLVNENKKILLILSINNFTLTTTSDMYKFQIRGHNRFGWTSYSDEKLISLRSMSIDQSISSNFNTKNVFLISGPMFILGLMLIVLIATIICYRKRTCRLKNASDCESLDYQKRQVLGHYGPDAFFNSNWTAPLWPSLAVTAKTYIDPHTYEDPTKAVQEFAHELDPNLIVIESVIGGGEFGEVCRGKLHQMNTSKEISVAIKTLKQGASEKTRLDFLSEASIMGQFNDDNVIYLEGVVTKHHPIMIVTEYMENGSLDTYLRTNEGNSCLDVLQLTRMLKGIASGMKYLSEMKYVHRDLAARNILVNKDLICKVADFGLSREIDQGDSYTTKGGKIPIRWTAIEAIDYRKFTSASDVWSFGVLCWEVISFGERPYWNWSNQDVIKAIKNAYRLPPPMNCPDVLYKLMIACWNEKYLERPKFIDIVQQLTHLIQSPNRLGSLAKERSFFVNHPDQPNLAQLTSISHWLENLQLDHLISFFHNQNYTNLSQICHFNLKNFNNLLSNYVSLNEKTRLLENLNQLRSQLILIPFKSEGYLV